MHEWPKKDLYVSVNGEPVVGVTAYVTDFRPNSGWNTGNYRVTAAGAMVMYSCMGYRAEYETAFSKWLHPSNGCLRSFNEPVEFDFTKLGGPRLRVVGGPGVSALHAIPRETHSALCRQARRESAYIVASWDPETLTDDDFNAWRDAVSARLHKLRAEEWRRLDAAACDAARHSGPVLRWMVGDPGLYDRE